MAVDLEFMRTYVPVILDGYLMTLSIVSVAFILAWAIGIVVGLCRLSRYAVLRAIAVTYVEVIRNIPLAIQVFLIFYTLPFFGIFLSAYGFGVVALAIYISSYYAELIRGAVNSVPRSQYESARGVGMSYLQAMRRVVFPQMFGYLIPPATNQTITLIKESSVLSIITVPELTMAAHTVSGITYSYVEVFLMIAILYWVTTLSLLVASRLLEFVTQRYRYLESRPGSRTGAAELNLERVGR